MSRKLSDDKLMLAALGICAYIVADVIHEVIGHGGACILSGGSISLLSSVYFYSNNGNILVDIWGPIANILAGILFLLVLNFYKESSTRIRYFFILLVAFNLFWGTGELIYSGLTNKDDWSFLISGLQPAWFWRTVLVVIGVILYSATIRIVSAKLQLITGDDYERRKQLILITYLSAGVSACFAASFDLIELLPAVKESALETFAGFIGFLLILRIKNNNELNYTSNSSPITRDMKWIISVTIIYVIFVVIMGQGMKFI